MKFFVGLPEPSMARHFAQSFISITRLRRRKSDFVASEWIMDSGAFSELATHGYYRTDVPDYAQEINRWANCGNMLIAVSQDFMCEPWIVQKTGLSVREHQIRTVQRYLALLACTPHNVMPVLQGYHPTDYVRHLDDYGAMLRPGAWVGVGSVCKRNTSPSSIEDILGAIKRVRPDLRLHGFGLKVTALQCSAICDLLHSADSMAWSFAARKQGRNANDWREAASFVRDIASRPKHQSLGLNLFS